MEKCGFCPVTPEDFEKTPPSNNPNDLTQLMTYPCGHSFHTQCVMNRLLQQKFCTLYGDIHIDSISCTHCESPPTHRETILFYSNYYENNRRILYRNEDLNEQITIATLYQENQEFRDSLFKYKKIKTEHNKNYKVFIKAVSNIKKEFHTNTKIAVETIRSEKKRAIKRASELPEYKNVLRTASKVKSGERLIESFYGGIHRITLNAALVKIDGAPKIKLTNRRFSAYYIPKFLFRLRVRI
jgi:hypothetical protein